MDPKARQGEVTACLTCRRFTNQTIGFCRFVQLLKPLCQIYRISVYRVRLTIVSAYCPAATSPVAIPIRMLISSPSNC